MINAKVFLFWGKNTRSDPLVSSFRHPVIEMLALPVARKGQEPRPVRNKWLAHFIRLSNPTSRFLDTPTGRNTNTPIDPPTGRNN